MQAPDCTPPFPPMMAVYNYPFPWLKFALASADAPRNFDENEGVDIKQFPRFSPSERKVEFFRSTPYIGIVGAVEQKLCRWDIVTSDSCTTGAKRRKVLYPRTPLRLRMTVNFYAGIPNDPGRFVSLLELKPVVKPESDCDDYGVFALVRFTEGTIITVKLAGEEEDADQYGGNRALNFGATFIRESDGENLPANARMTANGVIRATRTIKKGAEIILESSSGNARMAANGVYLTTRTIEMGAKIVTPTVEHPVDFLDRLVVKKHWRGDFFRPSVGRVKRFVWSSTSNGSVSFIVRFGKTGAQESIDASEIMRRSMYYTQSTNTVSRDSAY